MYRSFGKRLLDIVLAIVLIVVAVPLAVIVALLVVGTSGRPVLFRQVRPGKAGRLFTLLKFRTMVAQPENGTKLSDADRLTRIGIWLRRSSLDELPQVWNVLKGDMSFVGPRPLLMEYLDRYSQKQAQRHEVRPGLTGLAQVSGRNALSWDKKLAFDVEYVDRHSLWLDMQILWKTLMIVVRRAGINQKGHATAPEFVGTEGPKTPQ